MIIYLLNLFSIPFWNIFFKQIGLQRKSIKMTMVFVFFQMVLIAGLRNVNIGIDTKNYLNIYMFTQSVDLMDIFTYYLESGYVILNQFVKYLFDSFNALLFINSLITLIGVYEFINRFSKNKIMSLFLFITLGYFSSTMNIMRQYIALVFILNSYFYYIKEKNYFKVYINVLIASLFHSSSLFVAVAILFYDKIYSKKINGYNFLYKCLITLSVITFSFITSYIFQLVFNNEYYDYIVNGAGYTTSIFNLNFFIKVSLSIIYLFVRKKRFINKSCLIEMNFLNYLNFISCIVSIMAIKFSMFNRINLYFSFTLIVFIPILIENINMKFSEKKYIKFVIYLSFFIVYIVSLLSNNNGICPYQFYFSGGV